MSASTPLATVEKTFQNRRFVPDADMEAPTSTGRRKRAVSIALRWVLHLLHDLIKVEALRLLSEHILPGRWVESRQPNEKELKATSVLRLPIEEFSAKVRQGPAVDDEEDYAFPTWAGVIPLTLVAGEPVDDARLMPGVKAPEYARGYTRRR